MSKFTDWKNDADMPELVNGEWVDLETGIPFEQYLSKRAKPVSTAQDKYAVQIEAAKKASKTAKLKALTGTAAQKKWAVQIRFERFSTFTSDVAKEFINSTHFLNSKFWIQTRSLSAKAIEIFVLKIANMIIETNSINVEYNQILNLTPDMPGQPGRIVLSVEAVALADKCRLLNKQIEKSFTTFCS